MGLAGKVYTLIVTDGLEETEQPPFETFALKYFVPVRVPICVEVRIGFVAPVIFVHVELFNDVCH